MKAILYARVSTSEQGKSGLGLESQIEEMQRFCSFHKIEIVAVRQEVVSGGYVLDRRPVLKQAFADAKKHKDCVVLVSRVDRLSRRASLVLNLMDDGVKFMAAECGVGASNIDIHLRSIISQNERERIGERIKAAFRAKRERGEPMGLHLVKQRGQQERMVPNAVVAKKAEADSFAQYMKQTVVMLQNEGMTLKAMADYLNKHNYATARGKGSWYAQSVKNLIARL